MKSHLINILEISRSSKIMLRGCVEFMNKFPVDFNDDNQLFLNYIFQSTRLTFGEGLQAMEELQNLQLLEYKTTAKDLPTLRVTNLLKLIKTTMEDIEVNKLGSISVVDYKEICSMIEQKEADGFSTVSPVKQIVAS